MVEEYKRIRDSTDDDHKYDEMKWAAFSDFMDSFLVVVGDPTVDQPLGVMDVKSRVDRWR